MKRLLRYSFLLLLFPLLASCGRSEYHYPPVKLEYLTATTARNGTIASVVTDDFQRYAVLEDGSGLRLPGDTILRIITNYEEMTAATGESGVRLYGASKVFSPHPIKIEQLNDGMKNDPVEIVSIWSGNGYLNMILNVKETIKHVFHFIEQSCQETANGLDVHLSLYHDANGGAPYYAQRCYLSIPLSTYQVQTDVTAVNLSFTLNTYSHGLQSFTYQCPFAYVEN